MKLIKILPNFLTILNGICGCLAIGCIFINDFKFLNEYELVLVFVLLGAFLDFLDGYIARVFKVKSKIGIQLDSLSDLITFSLAPAFLTFDLMTKSNDSIEILSFISFLIVPFSMIRLARFNVLPTKTYFLGLPTPANGIFFIGLPFLSFNLSTYLIIFLIIISCFLLISNIKFHSFKSDYGSGKKNIFYVLFLVLNILSVVLLIYFNLNILNMVSISILIYIFSSQLFSIYKYF